MKKVYVAFHSKNDLLAFVEKIKNPLCVVDADRKRILCQLSEEDIDYAKTKYQASISFVDNESD